MDHDSVQELLARGARLEVIRHFAEFNRVGNEFLVGKNGFFTEFLIIIGPPGCGKSTLFRNADSVRYVNDALSGVGLYRLVWLNIGKSLAIDDIDELLNDRQVVALLKALGEPGDKQVCWEKQNSVLAAEGVPKNFTTNSRICIICNELPKINNGIKAMLDRAKVIIFDPSAQEIHKFVLTWWPNEHVDVAEFIGENLDKIVSPSIRWYNDAKREKLLGNDWREWLMKQWYDENPRMAVVAELHNSGIARGKPMVEEWIRRTGLGRAIFYRYQQAYLARQEPPNEPPASAA